MVVVYAMKGSKAMAVDRSIWQCNTLGGPPRCNSSIICI